MGKNSVTVHKQKPELRSGNWELRNLSALHLEAIVGASEREDWQNTEEKREKSPMLNCLHLESR